jgi:predicted Zn-dependent protease with MMP-like domain
MIRLGEDEFADLVEQAMAEVPDEFRPFLENLTVDVEARPDAEVVGRFGPGARQRLLGLYRGVPLPGKSVSAPVDWPERVTVYQRNIERICGTRAEAVRQIRRTVLHEIGHHFGLDEAALRRLGYG